MKKIWRLAILLSLASFIIQGCNDNDEPGGIISREKPVSWTRLLGPNEDEGEIPIDREQWQDFVVASGRGSFISAVISKSRSDNASTDNSLVKISLDYKQVSLQSFKQVRDMGLSEQNYSGVLRLEGEGTDNVETLVLGYSQPLYFDEVLILSVMVDDPIEDPKVEKILITVTFTLEDTGEDEGTGGGDSVPDFP